jgi:acid phosphatase (class A)
VFAFGAAIGAGSVFMLAPQGAGKPAGAPKSAALAPGAEPDLAPSDNGYDGGGYLPAGALQAATFLPPPPQGARADADRAVYKATRALKDTPRWALAVADSDQNPEPTMKAFSCAMGVNLTSSSAPQTYALLQRFWRDETPVLEPAKTAFKRDRPFLGDGGDVCIAKSNELVHSPDYPSGHGAWGWAVALILAEIEPDRANPLLARGRAFGESRVVCGVHNASAIEAGQLLGAAMVSALHSSIAFKSDLQGAAIELNALKQTGIRPDPGQCAAEAATLAKAAY